MPRYLLDLTERTLATYAESAIGLYLMSGVTGLSGIETAAAAAIPAGLAVVKGALSAFLGDHNTAAMLPADTVARR